MAITKAAFTEDCGLFATPRGLTSPPPVERRAKSVMTLHRWRKAPPGPEPAHEGGQPGRTRGAGDRIAQLQLENSGLRRLVTDLLLEKIKLEEAVQRQNFSA